MPLQNRQVGWFIDDRRDYPVFDYLADITDQTAMSGIILTIQQLSLLGVEDLIDTEMCKEIESPIYELRKDRHRILFGRDREKFVLLTAFLKETKKTPHREIELAKKRWRQYLEDKPNRFYLIRFPGQK